MNPSSTALREDFISWSLAPERTLEERFTTLLLVEQLSGMRQGEPNAAGQERRQTRRLNPAYEPVLDERWVRKAAEKLEGITHWSAGSGGTYDRVVRDLEVLRFLPGLRQLQLSNGADVPDLTALRHVPELRLFHCHSHTVEDYRPVALCRELREIIIHTTFPWPRMEGWETLEHLEDLKWGGPATGFLSLPKLPALRRLTLEMGAYNMGGPASLRDMHQLPELPELRHLWMSSVYYLDGVERYPLLQALRVAGPIRSLAPTLGLHHLTHLWVWSDELREVACVRALTMLHSLMVSGKRPQDYAPLAEAPALQEVIMYNCDLPQLDLDTLRMLLPGWDAVFQAQPPRALEALRLQAEAEKPAPDDRLSADYPDGPDGWDGNQLMRHSEYLWTLNAVRAALVARGYTPRAGVTLEYENPIEPREKRSHYLSEPNQSARKINVGLQGTRILSRMREVVACLRTALAGLRFRWLLSIHGDPSPIDPMDFIRLTDEELEDANEEYRKKMKREEDDYLAREMRLRLLEEEGRKPDPKDFISTPPPPEKSGKGGTLTATRPEDEEEPPMKFDEPNLDWNNRDEDDSEGGIKDADPDDADAEDDDEHWLKPPPNVDPNTFWQSLHFHVVLMENEMRIHHRSVEAVEYLMGEKAEPPPLQDEEG